MKKAIIIGITLIILLIGGSLLSKNLTNKSINNELASESDNPNDPIISKNGIHYHPEIEIYIYGEKQEISANIGLVGGHNPIHTHDADGIIHLEFGNVIVRNSDTHLGNFFKIWNKDFNSNQIFEHLNGPDGNVSMTVNGEPNLEFENYPMKDGDKIVIKYE